MTTLREGWASGRPTFGGWLALPSPVTAEAAATIGFDYVCADNQHGVLDYASTVGVVQAALLGGSRPIVRVPWNEPGVIGKMLDAGVEGVIVPMVNSAAEAAAVVRAVRYPPLGSRSFGPLLAGLRDADHARVANDTVAVIPMIETREALTRLDEILATPGIDAVYVGPADLSFSLGLTPANHDDVPEFADALAAIVAGCHRHGVVAGIHATGALAAQRLEQGFRMITVAADLSAMRAGMAHELAVARGAPGTSGASPATAVDPPAGSSY